MTLRQDTLLSRSLTSAGSSFPTVAWVIGSQGDVWLLTKWGQSLRLPAERPGPSGLEETGMEESTRQPARRYGPVLERVPPALGMVYEDGRRA